MTLGPSTMGCPDQTSTGETSALEGTTLRFSSLPWSNNISKVTLQQSGATQAAGSDDLGIKLAGKLNLKDCNPSCTAQLEAESLQSPLG